MNNKLFFVTYLIISWTSAVYPEVIKVPLSNEATGLLFTNKGKIYLPQKQLSKFTDEVVAETISIESHMVYDIAEINPQCDLQITFAGIDSFDGYSENFVLILDELLKYTMETEIIKHADFLVSNTVPKKFESTIILVAEAFYKKEKMKEFLDLTKEVLLENSLKKAEDQKLLKAFYLAQYKKLEKSDNYKEAQKKYIEYLFVLPEADEIYNYLSNNQLGELRNINLSQMSNQELAHVAWRAFKEFPQWDNDFLLYSIIYTCKGYSLYIIAALITGSFLSIPIGVGAIKIYSNLVIDPRLKELADKIFVNPELITEAKLEFREYLNSNSIFDVKGAREVLKFLANLSLDNRAVIAKSNEELNELNHKVNQETKKKDGKLKKLEELIRSLRVNILNFDFSVVVDGGKIDKQDYEKYGIPSGNNPNKYYKVVIDNRIVGLPIKQFFVFLFLCCQTKRNANNGGWVDFRSFFNELKETSSIFGDFQTMLKSNIKATRKTINKRFGDFGRNIGDGLIQGCFEKDKDITYRISTLACKIDVEDSKSHLKNFLERYVPQEIEGREGGHYEAGRKTYELEMKMKVELEKYYGFEYDIP